MCVSDIFEYLAFFRISAASAPAPGAKEHGIKFESAYVATMVASQTRQRPSFHGKRVIPSGRFPSPLFMPVGSRDEGTPHRMRALFTTSLTAACLADLPALKRHERGCKPMLSTAAPHLHVCGWHTTAPTLRATLILRDSIH